MKTYIAGADRKPCIWPAPSECIWTGERYTIKDCLQISLPDEFISEARLFADLLYELGMSKTEFIEVGRAAGIKVIKCSSGEVGSEGYFLDAGETGITIKTDTACGVFYAFQTLSQLLENSPGLSVCGVKIKDQSANAIRNIEVKLNKTDCSGTFKRFVDFAARYKINSMIVEADEGINDYELENMIEYMQQRHIAVKVIKYGNSAEGHSDGEILSRPIGSLEESVYRVIRLSHILWRIKSRTDDIHSEPLQEAFEKVALQLYPVERDRINRIVYPSRTGRNFKALELRRFYNAPLYRLSWRPGDYDFMYLTDAPYIPNSAPFSMFQGVNDFKLEYSFVLSGDGLNKCVFNIPIVGCVKSLIFLHSYINGENDVPAAEDSIPYLKVVGYYNVKYRDGETEKVEILYGETISSRYYNPASYSVAYRANPVFAGKTWYGDSYILYSQEWINPKPELQVESVDLFPAEGMEENGIALFGITAVI